jgi:predicted amino acid racemase
LSYGHLPIATTKEEFYQMSELFNKHIGETAIQNFLQNNFLTNDLNIQKDMTGLRVLSNHAVLCCWKMIKTLAK